MARVRSLLKPRPTSSRIKLADINFIADCVAKRLTESEACRLIGIQPENWQVYKNRHKAIIAPFFEATRAAQLHSHVEVIERAQTKDWRAADRLLSIKAPERFGKEQSGQQVATNDALGVLLLGALSKVYGTPSVVVSPSVAELPAPPGQPVLDVVETTSSEKTPPDA